MTRIDLSQSLANRFRVFLIAFMLLISSVGFSIGSTQISNAAEDCSIYTRYLGQALGIGDIAAATRWQSEVRACNARNANAAQSQNQEGCWYKNVWYANCQDAWTQYYKDQAAITAAADKAIADAAAAKAIADAAAAKAIADAAAAADAAAKAIADAAAKAAADKAAAELKAKQDAEAKAAAELKAKQEAEVKVAADKAAAELKAKQDAAEKAAAELKAKQDAEAKVAADSAAAELKAKQDAEAKAAAELKAKQEAEAKVAADKAAGELKAKQDAAEKVAAELKAKQDAEAKAVAEKIAAELQVKKVKCVDLNRKTDDLMNLTRTYKSKFKTNLDFANLLSLFPSPLNCDTYQDVFFNLYLGRLETFLITIDSEINSSIKAATAKKTTITCIKGKITKKVTAVKPVCPKGYKKK